MKRGFNLLYVLSILISLGTPSTPSKAGEGLPYNETDIIGIEDFRGSPEAREVLLEQGFVVTDETYRQICSFYIQRGPAFITTDSLLYAYYTNLERAFEKLEKKHAKMLPPILQDMRIRLSRLISGGENTKGLEELVNEGYYGEDWLTAADELDEYLLVAEVLSNGVASEEDRKDLPDRVKSEIELIYAAEGTTNSVLRGVKLDYTRFEPYGFYTVDDSLSDYYRAITWFRDVPFRVTIEGEAKQALLLQKLVSDIFYSGDNISSIIRAYECFLGGSDDLSLRMITNMACNYHFTDKYNFSNNEKLWTLNWERMKQSEVPLVPTIPDALGVENPSLYHGFRLMPRPTLYDNYVFTTLTPYSVERPPASGEELMAVMGSDTAKEIVMGREGADFTDYPGVFTEAVRVGDEYEGKSSRLWQMQKVVFGTLLEQPKDETLPPYYLHTNWRYKDLNTCLAGWAHYRYIYGAHTKRNITYMGLKDQPPGVIEPNISFFEALLQLNILTDEYYNMYGINDTGFNRVNMVLAQTIPILRKQLSGEALSESEIVFLRNYGPKLGNACGYESNIWLDDDNLNDTSFDVPISTDLYTGITRLVGQGRPRAIYVISEINGEKYLTVGGVLSYLDFLGTPNEVREMSSEGWSEAAISGLISPPEWQNRFCVNNENDQPVED